MNCRRLVLQPAVSASRSTAAGSRLSPGAASTFGTCEAARKWPRPRPVIRSRSPDYDGAEWADRHRRRRSHGPALGRRNRQGAPRCNSAWVRTVALSPDGSRLA